MEHNASFFLMKMENFHLTVPFFFYYENFQK